MFRFIPTASTGVKQTFGKFSKLASPGINFYIPFLQSITEVSNRVQQNTITLERVKTLDNVFASVEIALQTQIEKANVERAFFSLSDPREQTTTFVENVVRAKVPEMTLDDLFAQQDTVGNTIQSELGQKLSDYGITLVSSQVKNITPDYSVARAMNEINRTERLKIAAKNEADAEYIRSVRQAEADRDRKRLQGEGVAQQRMAILQGYEESIGGMADALDISHSEVLEFVKLTQTLDTYQTIGSTSNTKTIFLPPSGLGPVAQDLMNAGESKA